MPRPSTNQPASPPVGSRVAAKFTFILSMDPCMYNLLLKWPTQPAIIALNPPSVAINPPSPATKALSQFCSFPSLTIHLPCVSLVSACPVVALQNQHSLLPQSVRLC
ncbi:hypothetical protein D8B26_006712 [Coccidioides posadasii str. Silveira]|uniref:uncharacterized protein n=1 Tax=Coccidioides posadasii (strain RMSCC 757 / Silveira) TaxID=443226 RepID=UPI001BEF6132|nr:hypothetical protein D8B26_006712 [Coccidioides posadasii str. Silveira]